jgi:hypothetical protein
MSGGQSNLGYVPEPEVGFPEFESFHLTDFSAKAQFSKSVASTIPPRPRDRSALKAEQNRPLFHHQPDRIATVLQRKTPQ